MAIRGETLLQGVDLEELLRAALSIAEAAYFDEAAACAGITQQKGRE